LRKISTRQNVLQDNGFVSGCVKRCAEVDQMATYFTEDINFNGHFNTKVSLYRRY